MVAKRRSLAFLNCFDLTHKNGVLAEPLAQLLYVLVTMPLNKLLSQQRLCFCYHVVKPNFSMQTLPGLKAKGFDADRGTPHYRCICTSQLTPASPPVAW